jgi:hypothetical protein
MSDDNSNNKKGSWVVPITVALISAISAILVAWISKLNFDPPSSQSSASDSIVGSYKIVGNNPKQGSYGGTLDITKSGSAYQLVWNAGEQPAIGIGILSGNTLAVGWGSRKCAVVSYQLQPDGSLDGKSAALGQEELGLELAVPSNSDPAGDLANQYETIGKSPDGSSYKDTISVQQIGELYQFSWMDLKVKGTGIENGNILAVGVGDVPCNVVLYQVKQDGSLTGVWGLYNGNQAGTEEAVR